MTVPAAANTSEQGAVQARHGHELRPERDVERWRR